MSILNCQLNGGARYRECPLKEATLYIVQCILYIMDTLKVALLYRGVLYVEVILYSKECNWYTRCCPLNGGVRYRECPLSSSTSAVCVCVLWSFEDVL